MALHVDGGLRRTVWNLDRIQYTDNELCVEIRNSSPIPRDEINNSEISVLACFVENKTLHYILLPWIILTLGNCGIDLVLAVYFGFDFTDLLVSITLQYQLNAKNRRSNNIPSSIVHR